MIKQPDILKMVAWLTIKKYCTKKMHQKIAQSTNKQVTHEIHVYRSQTPINANKAHKEDIQANKMHLKQTK